MPKSLTEEELLKELNRLGRKLSKTPSGCDMREHGQYSETPYYDRFGSWNAAIEEAGFAPNPAGSDPGRKFTKEELADALQSAADELGRPPITTDVREGDVVEYSVRTYRNYFGTWNEALKEAGFAPSRRQNAPDEALLEELQRLGEHVDGVPSQADMDEAGAFSPPPYTERFGSWGNALDAAGLVDDTLYECPTCGDSYVSPRGRSSHHIHAHGESIAGVSIECEVCETPYRVSAHQVPTSRFCSLECRGKWQSEALSGRNSPLWIEDTTIYGEGWTEAKKEQVRERDGRECQCCGMVEEDHIAWAGRRLSVHHRVPAKEFDNDVERNHVDNLVTVCSKCHQKAETSSAPIPVELMPPSL